MSTPDEAERSARDRLRDAAVVSFARRGLGATLREIAADAGVTAGLVTHHFGSRRALREACDAEVLRRVRDLKTEAMHRSAGGQIAMMAQLDDQAATLAYVMRSLQAGGDAGRRFLQHFIDDARDYVREGTEAGLIVPSRDPEARLRLLATWQLGGLLLQLTLLDPDGLDDPVAALRRLATETTLPTLELYTEGLLASSELLEAYLESRRGTP